MKARNNYGLTLTPEQKVMCDAYIRQKRDEIVNSAYKKMLRLITSEYYALDIIILHNEFQFGYSRLQKFAEARAEYLKRYYDTLEFSPTDTSEQIVDDCNKVLDMYGLTLESLFDSKMNIETDGIMIDLGGD